jgi:hypothetical protein
LASSLNFFELGIKISPATARAFSPLIRTMATPPNCGTIGVAMATIVSDDDEEEETSEAAAAAIHFFGPKTP